MNNEFKKKIETETIKYQEEINQIKSQLAKMKDEHESLLNEFNNSSKKNNQLVKSETESMHFVSNNDPNIEVRQDISKRNNSEDMNLAKEFAESIEKM